MNAGVMKPGAIKTGVKCLLVDDLEENLVALSALMRSDDVETLMARSGAEALDLLLSHDVALALLDVQMPDMNGFELAELMRGSERTRHVPIIFLTAGVRDQHRMFKGYESGAVDFLYKPIEPHILRNKADVFFQLYRQRQQLVRELHERTETLRLNEMFAAVLGHDLRNPLGAILTGAHLIQRATTQDNVRETAGRMLSSGKRMSRLIDDLLDLTRARLAGGISLKCDTVDFGALLQRVVKEQEGAVPDRRVEVTQKGDVTGDWDPDRLGQVASNLIGNAFQHGAPNQPVRVGLDGTDPDQVVMSIENDGVIPPDILPHLFDPFRGGQRAGRNEGLGLGLYIVQQIVHAHGGRVEVHSTPETHTRFRVIVPRRVPAA